MLGRLLSLAALLAVAVLAFAGCAHSENGQKPEIALRRGGTWATFTVDPPRIVGPTARLELKNGELSGFLDDGAVSVKIEGEKADGFGPSGPVHLTITLEKGALKVDGMWNGGPVHLRISPGGVRGAVIQRGRRLGAAETICAYNVDNVDPDGGLWGSSTCAGRPLETHLAIDPGVPAALEPPALAVLMVALLSAPPRAS